MFIKPPQVMYLKEKEATSLKLEGLSQSGGHIGFGDPLKKTKIVISTFPGVLGKNKSKKIFGQKKKKKKKIPFIFKE